MASGSGRMTYAFALLAGGSLALLAGIRGRSLQDVLRGITSAQVGPGERGFAASFATPGSAVSGSGSQLVSLTGGVGGLGHFDGETVAAWIVPWLQKARASGLWHGSVTSGYRTPSYSESLCLKMCGAPSCPGTCAGRSSNHSGKRFPEGAVDVSDPAGFAAAMRAVHGPLRNDLPADRGHFSVTGH